MFAPWLKTIVHTNSLKWFTLIWVIKYGVWLKVLNALLLHSMFGVKLKVGFSTTHVDWILVIHFRTSSEQRLLE